MKTMKYKIQTLPLGQDPMNYSPIVSDRRAADVFVFQMNLLWMVI